MGYFGAMSKFMLPTNGMAMPRPSGQPYDPTPWNKYSDIVYPQPVTYRPPMTNRGDLVYPQPFRPPVPPSRGVEPVYPQPFRPPVAGGSPGGNYYEDAYTSKEEADQRTRDAFNKTYRGGQTTYVPAGVGSGTGVIGGIITYPGGNQNGMYGRAQPGGGAMTTGPENMLPSNGSGGISTRGNLAQPRSNPYAVALQRAQQSQQQIANYGRGQYNSLPI
jgi:hypothetical protein